MKKILFIILIWAWIFWYMQYSGYQDFLEQEIVVENNTIEIPKDTTPRSYLINELEMPEKYVKAYFKLTWLNPRFEAWKFYVEDNLTIENFFEALNNPIIDWDVNFVLKEWQNIYDIDTCLSNPSAMRRSDSDNGCLFNSSGPLDTSLTDRWSFVAYAQSETTVNALRSDFPFLEWATSLEGFLYPDTYKINKDNYSHENLAKKMLQNFAQKIMDDEELIAEFWDDLAQVVADNIIIASIVEREIASPWLRQEDEAEKVAGVLKKRYEENWQIGADATVCYPYGITSAECTPSFVLDKLYEKNDYNTRQMVGLPKTPIANPYIWTIKSTILSKNSIYYFYLHAPDGKIYYAETNAGHEANKRAYLR